LDRRLKRVNILSVAQFRPEKDHALQLRALAEARRRAAAAHDGSGDAVLAAHLRLVGSCRNSEDESRIERLRGEAGARGCVVGFLLPLRLCSKPALAGH
jgi:alpha-1,2-mannosyltransferase